MHELVDAITLSIQQNSRSNSVKLIEALSAAEVARVIESLPSKFRLSFWELVPSAPKGEVLLELHGNLRRWIIRHTDEDILFASLTAMQMDELADLDDDLPAPFVKAMVKAMDARRRLAYELVQQYPDDSAGGLMDTDATRVRPDVKLKVVLRYLRRLRIKEGTLPEHLDSLMVVDRKNKFVGTLPLSILVSFDIEKDVEQAMLFGLPSITPFQPATQVARIFEDLDCLSAPVIDENGHLLGRITVDDVVNVMRDEADRKILGRVGLEQHPDMFAPIWPSSYRRALWLGINLVTAFVAAGVIGLFDASIEKLVSLAVLMPVVASMGGVAGNQTLTLVTRGIALEQIGRSNLWLLVGHELGIGIINGIFLAFVVTLVACYWFGGWSLGLIFGSAVMITILTGALAGALIPLWLKRLGIDPAVAGGVVLTTATDAVGFFVFLGLATLLLL